MNDPKAVVDTPTRAGVIRGSGTTPSEQFLARLCEGTFLNLWSYPNVYFREDNVAKGDGKELCDLLVVCGDQVLIFSDKRIAWPEGVDTQLAWKRWSRRAILKSAAQISGAERRLREFPNTVFVDKSCNTRLPIALPPIERRKVHGIAVVSGAESACLQHKGGEFGGLMISGDAKGVEHYEGDNVKPFAVGDLNPAGTFIHILDEAALNSVMQELDTISDITHYLNKKEALIRSPHFKSANNEEDLIAYYLSHLNSKREHDFTRHDGSALVGADRLDIHPGAFSRLKRSRGYVAKKSDDRASYVWDRLIESFTANMLAGTTIVEDGNDFSIQQGEACIRYMALVPRYIRRGLGSAVLDALEKGKEHDRFVRVMIAGPNEKENDTAFIFMTLALPKQELAGGYNQYRAVRKKMASIYALATLKEFQNLKRAIAIATEPPSGNDGTGSSEDLVYVEKPSWTNESIAQLKNDMERFDILKDGRVKKHSVSWAEFPRSG